MTKSALAVAASKDGKPLEIEIHQDGKIVERSPFAAVDAKKTIIAQGYDLVGEPTPIEQHFETLARKVDNTDPRSGTRVP